MTPITLTAPWDRPAAPTLAAHLRVTLSPAGSGRWRVRSGPHAILGHLERREGDRGTRYAARRYLDAARGFVDLGEFWSADDAVECLRHS